MIDVLIFPNNLGIAHPMRSYLVCKELENRGYSTKIAYSGPYADFIKGVIRIDGIAKDYDESDYNGVMKHIHENPSQFPFGNPNKMRNIAEEEIELIKKTNPSVVIGDTRTSLLISSQATSTPYISITNANMTPYFCDFSDISKTIKCNLRENIEFYNTLLKVFGSDNSVNNFYEILVGDMNLVADIPGFSELLSPPEIVKYVGPILWSSDKTPEWMDEIKQKRGEGKKIAYVTMGGTGHAELYNKIINGLKLAGYGVVVSTGRSRCALADVKSDVYVTDFISEEIFDVCDVAVCHGGNSTIYLSLKHGVPILGIPTNPDQTHNVDQAVRLKVGVGQNGSKLRPEDIAKSLEFVSANGYRERAAEFSKKLQTRGEITAANEIEVFGNARCGW